MTEPQLREMVTRVMVAAQKYRSNMAESDLEEVARLLDPAVYRTDGLGVVDVCLNVLRPGREVAPIDVWNVLTLAHRSEVLRLSYGLRWHADLPDAMEVFR